MTDEVAALVLRNNYLQPLAISLAERRGAGELGFARRFMQVLEGEQRLDRAVEFLPDDVALAERARRGEGLTRPEIAVLLAYAKLALHDRLLDSPIPDDPYLGRELERYFPAQIRQQFPDAISGHRLRREIIATQVANAIINRAGPTVVTRLADETGADAPAIAASYAATRDSFGLTELNAALDGLDGKIPGGLQLELYAGLQDLLLHRMVWFLRNVPLVGALDEVVARFRPGIAAVQQALVGSLCAEEAAALRARAETLAGQGVPEALAARLAGLVELSAAPDIVLIAERTGRKVEEVAATHFAVAAIFRINNIISAASDVAASDYYDRLALDRAVDAIGAGHRRLTAQVAAGFGSGVAGVAAWTEARGPEVARIREAVEGIVAAGLTLSKLMVAASLLGDLARE
jgi:glutamate dehydrogenase